MGSLSKLPGEDVQGRGMATTGSSSLSAPVTYLYWMVSDVVDARNFVIRILTMLNRNTKLIWREEGREGKRSGPS